LFDKLSKKNLEVTERTMKVGIVVEGLKEKEKKKAT
jgi:hypothetical protein